MADHASGSQRIDSSHSTAPRPAADDPDPDHPSVVPEPTLDREALVEEHQPQGALERFLTQQIAENATGLQRATAMEGAVTRRIAAAATRTDADAADLSNRDLALASVGCSEALARVMTYRRSREKSFYRALETLQDLQARRQAQPQRPAALGFSGAAPQDPLSAATAEPNSPVLDPEFRQRFHTEDYCETYLLQRLQTRPNCSRCSSPRSTWLEERQRRQCLGCRHQAGPRTDTVMHNSRIPLRAWFYAIEALRRQPSLAVSELQEICGVARTETVREMRQKIQAASTAANASRLLAGLTDDPEADSNCAASPAAVVSAGEG